MSDGLTTTDNRLTSERIKPFQDALELLYIRSNISGRLHFAHEWPAPAHYIFGDELQAMDREGTPEKYRRAELEMEAEDRRVALLDTVLSLEERSAERGVLNMSYVRDTVIGYGRSTALLLYAQKIVDRFIPPPVGEDAAAAEKPQHTGAYTVPEPEIEIEALPKAMAEIPLDIEEEQEAPPRESIDPMDTIQPISTDAPSPPPAPVAAGPAPRVPSYDDLPPVRAAQPPPDNNEDKPFAPNTFERVEEEPPAQEPKRGKLKIFGIKDNNSDNNSGNNS